MIFNDTPLPGVFLIEPERLQDERGFFARTFCAETFAAQGLVGQLVQCSISSNPAYGTLRGMHFQRQPYCETRLVRCTMGAIFDVVIDLRPQSPTYCEWTAAELTADNRLAMYIPEGCAHGFLTLAENSEVFYQMSEFYHAEVAAGVRWNDPAFAIKWQFQPDIMSSRDAAYPDYVKLPPV